MNPARSFGPAFVAGLWEAHWVYWLGPLLGAALGAGAYQLLHAPRAVTIPPANGADLRASLGESS